MIASPRTVVVHGSHDATGACNAVFSPGPIAPGTPPQTAVEIDRDDDACTATFAVGPSTAAQARQQHPGPTGLPDNGADPEVRQGVVGQSNHATNAAGGPLTAAGTRARTRLKARAAYSHQRAYLRVHTIGENYFGTWDLNWVYNSVSWDYGSGCVHNPVYYGTDYGASSKWSFSRVFVDWAYGASCDFSYSSSLERFQTSDNGSPCNSQGVQGYSLYNRNSIHGNPNGSYTPYDGLSWCIDEWTLRRQIEFGYF